MSKESVMNLVNLIPEEDMETIYNVLIRFVPESEPLPDEIEAIERANKSIAESGTVSHDEIDWD